MHPMEIPKLTPNFEDGIRAHLKQKQILEIKNNPQNMLLSNFEYWNLDASKDNIHNGIKTAQFSN